MTDYFDLAGYLKVHPGLFPSQYFAAVTILVISIPVGIIWTIFLRRYQLHKARSPINVLILPVVTFIAAGVGFFIFDNNVREHDLYTYNYYQSSTNPDLAKWMNSEYGLDLTQSEAGSLKFQEAPAILWYGEVVHPKSKLPNGKTVQLGSEVSGAKLSIHYVTADGKNRDLLPVQ